MEEFVIATGKTREEAVDNGCAKLGVSRDDVHYEILEREGSKFFGLKKIPAKVKVSLSEEYLERVRAEEKKAEEKKFREKKREPKPEKTVPAAEAPKEPKEPKEPKKQEKPKQKPQPKKEAKEPKPEKKPAPEVKEEAAPAVKSEEPKEEVKVLPPEVLEEKGSAAAGYIKEILVALGYPDADVTYTQKDGMIVLQLSGDNMGVVVGKRGDNLDAMQYLASLVANRSEGSYVRVVLDVDDYRSKREASLRAYARKTATQAVRNQRSITLEAMNPYERRIVHSTVQTVAGATSKSIGTEPNRRVVISPIEGAKHHDDKKRFEGKGERRGSRGGRRPSGHRDSQKVVVPVSNEPPKNDTNAISLYGRIDLD